MRSPYVLFMSVVCCATLSSCFKEEPLNAECDIEEAYIHADNPEEMFFQCIRLFDKKCFTRSTI